MRVRDIVAEPLTVNRDVSGGEDRERVAEVFHQVGLHPQQADNYPHELSGGQRQRIAVARCRLPSVGAESPWRQAMTPKPVGIRPLRPPASAPK